MSCFPRESKGHEDYILNLLSAHDEINLMVDSFHWRETLLIVKWIKSK